MVHHDPSLPAMSSPLAPVLPVVLRGRSVTIEPLSPVHADELRQAARFPEICQWTLRKVHTDASFDDWLAWSLEEAEKERAMVFAIRETATGRAIGSTRYFDIEPTNRGLEIGYTWLTPRVWRTAVNTECKYLLLRHAFEALGCVRVQLKTNVHNARSRAAITRIGGKMEGILRKHAVEADGVSFRDTVFFSIIDDEWPATKAMLEGKLARA